jgi:hypothetical protein
MSTKEKVLIAFQLRCVNVHYIKNNIDFYFVKHCFKIQMHESKSTLLET